MNLHPKLSPLAACVAALVLLPSPSSTQNQPTYVGWDGGARFPYPREGDFHAAHVKRTGSLDSAFEVSWETTVRGSATPSKDFAISGGVLEFAPGDVEKTVSIPVLDDGLSELPETIELRLFSASNGVAIREPLNTITVIDNEIPATLDPAFLNLRGRAAPGIERSWFAAARSDGGVVALYSSYIGVPKRLLYYSPEGVLISCSKPIRFGDNDDLPGLLRVTRDNKAILSAGFTEVNGIPQPGLVRFLPDGSLDEDFKPPGDLVAGSILLTTLRDGRLLLQKSDSPDSVRFIRLLENGAVDPEFLQTQFNFAEFAVADDGAVLELPGGEVLAQASPSRWIRLLPSGKSDPAFNPALQNCEDCDSFALPDGSIVVSEYRRGGLSPLFKKLHPDGSMDETFAVPPWVSRLGPALPEGRLIATAYQGGGFFGYFGILKHDGSVDENYPGFDARSNGDACRMLAGAISETIGSVHSCVGRVNGARVGQPPTYGFPFGARVLLRGPFKKLIYAGVQTILGTEARVAIEILRSGDTTESASVRYRTRDGTASAGQHYAPALGLATFAPLENRKAIEIGLLQRSRSTETFEVVLSDASGAEIAGSPITVILPGDESRFAANPVRLLESGAPIIEILGRDASIESPPFHSLEVSEDFRTWTTVTDPIIWGDQGRVFVLDPNDSARSQRFYRLRLR